jgi:hypothetical protein
MGYLDEEAPEEMLVKALRENGETVDDLVSCVWGEEMGWHGGGQGDPKKPICTDYGGTEGPELLAHTKRWVYFWGCYDGAQWIESVPRNPTGKAIPAVGGG